MQENERSPITLVLGFPKSDSALISRIKTIDGIKVLAQAHDRAEVLRKTIDFHPDILFVTSALEGNEEWSLLVSSIPDSIRILMYLESEMNILVKDMLEENGVEFVSDLSVGGLETLFLGPKEPSADAGNDENDENDESSENKSKTKVIKPRGKLNIKDKLEEVQSVAINATKSAVAVVAEAAETAIKNINMPSPKTEPKAVKYKNVITVYSDYPGTGITFIASNVAVKLSELGYKVCLVDLSFNNTIHTIFKLPLDDNLKNILNQTADQEENIESAGFSPRRYPGLCIFANADNTNHSDIKISNFIKKLSSSFDFVVLDTCSQTAQNASAFSKILLEVIDIDATHWPNKAKDDSRALIVNKFSDSELFDIEPAKEVKNLFIVPMRHESVMRGIYTSVLPCTFDDKLNSAFLKIAEYIEIEGGHIND